MRIFEMTGNGEQASEEPKVTELSNDATNPQNPEVQPAETTGEEKKTIVLDGPLSKIMSHALMMLYGKEETEAATEGISMAGGMLMKVHEQQKNKINTEQKDAIYVYSYDNKNADSQRLLDAIAALDVSINSDQYSRSVLVVECHRTPNDKLGIILEFARKSGIQSFVSVESAAKALIAQR